MELGELSETVMQGDPSMRKNLVPRRDVLVGLCAMAGVASVSRAASTTRPAQKKLTGLIDVHHHILPPQAPAGMSRLLAGWSATGAIAAMDNAGVAAAMAYPGPILSGSDQERRDKARLWNEFGATLGSTYPTRFGLFASLPFPHVDHCLAEIDFALSDLKADGFGIATSYDERFLGDESFWPIYEKLDSHGAVVFVHPHDAACCSPDKLSYNQPILDGSWIEWPINTARTIMSLLVSGTTRRFAKVKFIFAHGGGVMPLLVKRVGGFDNWPAVGAEKLKALFPQGIAAEFAKLRFECAQACSPTNMNALRSLVPDSNILFGSDFPFFPLSYATQQFAELALSPATRRAIARSNASSLLPRWA
jgi:6-methylsalicylate decarboxylase